MVRGRRKYTLFYLQIMLPNVSRNPLESKVRWEPGDSGGDLYVDGHSRGFNQF